MSQPKSSIWGILGAIAGLSALGGGCFVAGQAYVKYEAAKSEADLRAIIQQRDTSLSKLEIHNGQLSSRVQGLENGYKALQEAYLQSSKAVSALQSRNAELQMALGRQSNCTFVQEQIRATQAMIDRPVIRIISSTEELRRRDEAERAELVQRLSRYQQQLSSCSQ